MMPEPATDPGDRVPAEVIRHAVWLDHLVSLSLRDVELLLAERGITVTHESIRRWVLRFGADFAGKLRRRRPRPGDTRHMDEVLLRVLLQLLRPAETGAMVRHGEAARTG